MTDETKKLFDAPWEIRPCNVGYDVVSAYNSIAEDRIFVAHADSKATVNCLARLPELYDALMEAKNEMFIILNEWALGKSEVDYLASYKEREGKNNYEFFNEIQELLRKVRDGE